MPRPPEELRVDNNRPTIVVMENNHSKNRIFLYVPANGWNKELRIRTPGTAMTARIKAGDSSGHVSSKFTGFKFDSTENVGDRVTVEFWKPKAFGIWYSFGSYTWDLNYPKKVDVRIFWPNDDIPYAIPWLAPTSEKEALENRWGPVMKSALAQFFAQQ